MATLQKIRNRGGLMVAIVIGLALGAFVLGDMLNSGSTLMRPSQLKIAEVDGEKIEYPDFQRKVEELTEIYKLNTQSSQIDENTVEQLREQVWQEYLQETILGKTAENLGIGVSSEELFDLIQGNNPHPIIQQLFRNPETGQFDKSAIIPFLKTLDNAAPANKAYWLYVEKQIKSDQLVNKYNNLVAKGLYVTSNEAKESLDAKNKSANFEFIALNYSSVSDADVKLSDSELKAYFDKHKDDYKEENTRTIEYVTFTVAPSAGDVAATEKWLNDTKADFATATDNAQFISINSDTPFSAKYSKKEELPSMLSDWAFAGKAGDIYGPYRENDEYKLVKIDDIRMLPDSAQASHILITPATTGSLEKAKAKADSLKRNIDLGGNFAELAAKYSEDTGSKTNGGDLGWFKAGLMVPEFEQAVFTGEINKLYVVESRYGYHIIKPTKKGKEIQKVRLAILSRKITPSSETYQKVYAEASKFAAENLSSEQLNKSIASLKLDKKIATLKENDQNVTGLQQSRSLVRAAFAGEKGQVLESSEGSTIFEFGDKFAIAALTGITEEGSSTFESAKARVEMAVRNEKKAEILTEKLKNAAAGQSDLASIASKLSTDVKQASAINFTSYSIPAVGYEPALIGATASLPEGKVSSPIKGTNGVYLAKVTSIINAGSTDLKGEKTRLAQTQQYQTASLVFESMKKMSEIEDRRAKFY